VELGVSLVSELIVGFLEQVESRIQVLVAAVLVAVEVGDAPGDRAVRQPDGQLVDQRGQGAAGRSRPCPSGRPDWW
jgi:hypothetical protein